MNAEKQLDLNFEHARTSKAGDVWIEHFLQILVVLEVNEITVNFCTTKKKLNDGDYTWNLDVVEEITRKSFAKYFKYTILWSFVILAHELANQEIFG